MTFQEYLSTLRLTESESGPFTDPIGILEYAKADYEISTKDSLIESLALYVAPFRLTDEIRKSVDKVWATYETACAMESKRAIEKRKQRLQALIG